MEGHVTDDVRVSNKDVGRVERAIRSGLTRERVFPRLTALKTTVDGEGLSLKVHFTKVGGAPVQFKADPEADAAAIREVDLQKKFHWGAQALAKKLGLSTPKAKILRDHLGIDEDEDCRHVFVFGRLRLQRFSDNALVKMQEALKTIDIDELWRNRQSA
jgi:hypothetical protein